jgi:hypothetical protein
MPELPAGPVPVAAKLRVTPWHYHHVADALRDLLLAARAEIGLPGLKRVHPADLDVVMRPGLGTHATNSGGPGGHSGDEPVTLFDAAAYRITGGISRGEAR